MSELDNCPKAKYYTGWLSQHLKLGRKCDVDGSICFHFDKPKIYLQCPVRLHGKV